MMKHRSTVFAFLILAASCAIAQTTIQFTAIQPLPSNRVELTWSSDTNRLFAILGTTDLRDWDNVFCAGIFKPSTASNTYCGICAVDATPCFFQVFATPPLGPLVTCHTSIGTASNDSQVAIGAPGKDYVIQFGEGGNDVQWTGTSDGHDWTAQFGGTGDDAMTARGGSGNDRTYQNAGDGDDTLYVQGGDGNDLVIQCGGAGIDNVRMDASEGDDSILQRGGPGDDTFKIEAGPGDGDDRIEIRGDDDQDTITYEVGEGTDTAWVDGGADYDTLEVDLNGVSNVRMQLCDGTPLYANGASNTVVTVQNLEYICVVPTNNGIPVWSWTAP